MTHRRNIAATVGGWSARHRKTAIFGWLLFVVLAVMVGNRVGTAELKGHEALTGDSAAAEKIIEEANFPDKVGETVIVQSATRTADSAAFRATVQDVVAKVTATGQVENVRSPLDRANPAPVSADKHAALVMFDMKGDPDTAVDRVQPVLDAVAGVQRAHPDLYVAEAGGASGDKEIGETLDEDFKRAEMLSIPFAFGILLATFGAVLAALIPVGLAMTAIFAATGLLALTSHLLHVDSATANVMLLIGLAVGVDYSLFYIKREREERARGRNPQRALAVAAATSGRAVLISGLTVMIAMAGMFLTGDGTFMGFAEGTILVVLIAVIGSVTILPGILSLLGDRLDARIIHGTVRVLSRGRLTWPRVFGRAGKARLWSAILDRVLRHPLISASVAAVALVALAIPAFGMHTATPGFDDLQSDQPIVQAFRHIDQAFPGGNDPAVVVVKAPDVTTPEAKRAIEDFRTRAIATGEANEPFEVEVNPDKTVAELSIAIKGKGNDSVSEHAVRTLREDVVPQSLDTLPGATAHVTGNAAGSMDFNDQVSRSGPRVFAFVLLLAFAILLIAFRSLVIAAKAIVLNLLSIGAAYGLLVLVFQKGWGESVLGFTSTGAITNWLPLFMFVVLFGLSMDYHVFILSRVREAYDRGMSTDQAVAHGIKSTAGVVTSAALIMVAVFLSFVPLSLESFKQLSVGLAAAVLIDATIVRAILLPATMKLLGDWNWYLPRWLDWLPHLEHGDGGEDEPAGAVEPSDERKVKALA
jgi:RND superfamily putative drug exporter